MQLWSHHQTQLYSPQGATRRALSILLCCQQHFLYSLSLVRSCRASAVYVRTKCKSYTIKYSVHFARHILHILLLLRLNLHYSLCRDIFLCIMDKHLHIAPLQYMHALYIYYMFTCGQEHIFNIFFS